MNEICLLTSLELRSAYGINKFLHTRNKREKQRQGLIFGAYLLVALIIVFYVGALVFALCSLGLGDIVPSYLGAVAALLVLVFGIFTVGNTLFGKRGYDILFSMPIKTSSVVISRLAAIYIEDLILSGGVMLTGAVVFGIMQKPSPLFYIMALVGAILLPIIPLAVSVLFGTLVMLLSSKIKHKSIVQALFMLAVVVGVLLLSFGFQNAPERVSEEYLISIAESTQDMLARLYLPAVWLGEAMSGTSPWGLVWLFLLSCLLGAACILLSERFFHGVVRKLSSVTARRDFKMAEISERGLLKTLYVREARRYFSSGIYVTNTIIGPILGCIASIALCVVGIEKIEGALPEGISVASFLPFAVSAVFCMMTTTSVAISMEGKHFWAVKSMPVPTKVLLDSKILLNLSLMLPFYIVSEVFLIVALKPDWLSLLWLLLIPALLAIFSAVFGIFVNLKLHSFDWEREEQAVKQSGSAMLGGFAGALTALVLGALIFAVPERWESLARAVECALLAVLTLVLYRSNNKVKLEEL